MATAINHEDVLQRAVHHIARDDRALLLLANAYPALDMQAFVEHVERLCAIDTTTFGDFPAALLSWCRDNAVPTCITHAIEERRRRRNAIKKIHVRLVKNLGLGKEGNLRDIPVVQVKRPQVPYPPPGMHHAYPANTSLLSTHAGKWICESDQIRDLWENHLKTCKQPDKRLKRRSVHMVDVSELQVDLPPDASAIIKDGDKLVAIVIRGFCGEPEVVAAVDDIVVKAAEVRKSIRVSASNPAMALADSQFESWKTSEAYSSQVLRLDLAASPNLHGLRISSQPNLLLKKSVR
jgi:hypothetical protein